MEGLGRTSMQRTANCAPSCSYAPSAQALRHSRAGAHAAPGRPSPRLREQHQAALHGFCNGEAALFQLPQHRRRGLQVWLLARNCGHALPASREKARPLSKGDKQASSPNKRMIMLQLLDVRRHALLLKRV